MEVVVGGLMGVLCIVSGVLVISAKNPIHALYSMIIAFVNGVGIMIIEGSEAVGILILIIYVGAIAILFLFVVMMIDIRAIERTEGVVRYIPVGALMGIVLMVELIIGYREIGVNEALRDRGVIQWSNMIDSIGNIERIGREVYSVWSIEFIMGGVILLIALIGAIVLTKHDDSKDIRRQQVYKQVVRKGISIGLIRGE